jgi:serine/threonine protein phosphatase PrpC
VQCSDGIHVPVREPEMAELVTAHPPEAACRAMVRRAREEGGEDNLSVQIAIIVDCPPSSGGRSWWRLGR